MTDIEALKTLKNKIFDMSNEHCFIERERFLDRRFDDDTSSPYYYAELLSDMLDSVSTPIDDADIFAGRVIEAAPEKFHQCPSKKIFSKGHLIPNYPKLLSIGYKGILEEIKTNAKDIGTDEARIYADNAETLINAIRRYTSRYSEAARAAGKSKAAEALSRVPFEPAYDLYSALQSVWIVHMISSCYVGYRDYAFGYMDEYLYPYYLAEKEKGVSDEDIRNMLAGFLIKPNEICGRHTHNYKQKPVLCQASKQYVLLDGGRSNQLSTLILEAARLNSMAQPTVTVVLSDSSPDSFKDAVFEAMADITDKMQVYNCEIMKEFLHSRGLPAELCDRPALSACCTFDICHNAVREEFYLPTVQLFCKTLFENEFSSKQELMTSYSRAITEECEKYLSDSRYPDPDWARMVYVLDTLLLSGCNESCSYPPHGLIYRAKNIFLPGLATLGDSLCALDRLVFDGKIPYAEFVNALKADFVGFEDIHKMTLTCPKFGNDLDSDSYTAEMADALLSAVEAAKHDDKEIVAPSFYSLERENSWAANIPATPDGRRSGQPFSENQSPVYGTDKNGITALLCSMSKIPFYRTAAGGLNLTFSSKIEPNVLKALVTTYFEKGGLHTGITVLDRSILEDAMLHPEKYRSLTVRLYGFSEYFICLPEWQQIAVLNRTAY